LVHKDLKVQLDHKDLKEHMAPLEVLEELVLKDLPVRQDLQVR
tara:strand:- start:170 stop:298 length:129 start_codon:yes stop_codon:yes gene_type:complete